MDINVCRGWRITDITAPGHAMLGDPCFTLCFKTSHQTRCLALVIVAPRFPRPFSQPPSLHSAPLLRCDAQQHGSSSDSPMEAKSSLRVRADAASAASAVAFNHVGLGVTLRGSKEWAIRNANRRDCETVSVGAHVAHRF